MDGNTVGGNSLCANCGWRWHECIATKEQFKSASFMIWIKAHDRPLCWLCAQVCPFLDDAQKNPRNLTFASSTQARSFRRLHMMPPCDPDFDMEREKQCISGEIWRDPFSRDHTTSSTSNIFVEMTRQFSTMMSETLAVRSTVDKFVLEYVREINSKLKRDESPVNVEEAANAGSSSDPSQNHWSREQHQQWRSSNSSRDQLLAVPESEINSTYWNTSSWPENSSPTNTAAQSEHTGADRDSSWWNEGNSWTDYSSWHGLNRWNRNDRWTENTNWNDNQTEFPWSSSTERQTAQHFDNWSNWNNSNGRESQRPRLVWDPPRER